VAILAFLTEMLDFSIFCQNCSHQSVARFCKLALRHDAGRIEWMHGCHKVAMREMACAFLPADYCLLRKLCIGGTDIPVCASRGTDRNVCATDALVTQHSVIHRIGVRGVRWRRVLAIDARRVRLNLNSCLCI
jgi:hypothetical protein